MLSQAIGQSTKKVSTYLTGQFSFVAYQNYEESNPKGPGLGIHTFINTKSKIKPVVDLSVDLLISGKGPFYLVNEGKEEVEGTLANFFVGASYHPGQTIFFSLAGGPSLFNGRAVAGVKGSFGFYFSSTQRWMGKISAIHLFNQEPLTKEDAGLVSFTLGLRLF